MFSGVIEGCGPVTEILRETGALFLWIEGLPHWERLKNGESVSCDGICLTVLETRGKDFKVQVSSQTQALSHLGELRLGSRVNLERALGFGERNGGHFVLGHADTTAILHNRRVGQDGLCELALALPRSCTQRYLIPNGCIALNGVSLTLREAPNLDSVVVGVLPYTNSHTNLGKLELGQGVSLEWDYLAKIVHYHMRGTLLAYGNEGAVSVVESLE